ncbi:activated Cdc42 kinase-like isoform X2 [Leptidea sinapis]|uniref:activated Cdc42 kinase-like isoform X2 n=1 Tax=Leptidea sinapis TaxID=189913 RepID=UPI0021C3B008|nr:activated Cdc42 kinase-like isoform X2 [Leptidea sinapis]
MANSTDDRESLREFLVEAELGHHVDKFRKVLNITNFSQLHYVTVEDLVNVGLSKPEQRRFKKRLHKHFPHNYLMRFKKLFRTHNRTHENANHGTALPTCFDTPPAAEGYVKMSPKHIISEEDVTINKELGMGQFGVVQQGTWNTGNQRLQVAIKCLGNERMTSNSAEFLKEAAVMHSIEHPNIVRLYGVVLHMESLMLVTELAPLRSLLECLREVTFRRNFPVPNLCEFAEQICDGMTYLETKRLIHRDLAARNILVFNKNKVKISDFGLSRALGVGKDYYQTNYNVELKLPVAWCAPECILFLRFTSASDIWAFGVCLWEMFTYGFQPWVALSGQQILEAIDAPNYQRLERPECCPDAYYNLMLECWAHMPNRRPKFRDLNSRLKHIRPEQVQTTRSCQKAEQARRSNLLDYKVGDQITVLGKENYTKSSMWYGVSSNGACGIFDPKNTKPIVKLERSFASSFSPHMSRSNRSIHSSILRSDVNRHTFTGKRTIQRSMISSPIGDLKHTSHVGLDGAYFGDISFLDPGTCIVTPYKPSEDLEQVPLINPNSPSHLSGTNTPYPLLISEARGDCDQVDSACAESKSKTTKKTHFKSILEPTTSKSLLSKVKSATLGRSHKADDGSAKSSDVHEYHEISDTDTESNATDNAKSEVPPESPGISKAYSFSQSLIAEMEVMFRNFDDQKQQGQRHIRQTRADFDVAKRANTLSKAERKKSVYTGTMKPMSAHDEKTLATAVAMANEITNKSMTDLDEAKLPPTPSEKSKFLFKLPLVGHSHHEVEKETSVKRNFSEEANSVLNIQESITEMSKIAYASLVEEPTPPLAVVNHTNAIKPKTPPRKINDWGHPSTMAKPFASGSGICLPAEETVDVNNQPINIVPLPPRGTKPKLVDKPRHVRKHPLILNSADIPPPPKNVGTQTAPLPIIYVNTQALVHKKIIYRPTLPPRPPTTNPFTDPYPQIEISDLSSNPFNCYIGNLAAVADPGEDTIFEEVHLTDHVSVEDLLQFADRKPSSKQRGVESDEVRIMSKVLKEQASPEECLEALEFTDWDIHVAIKLLQIKGSMVGATNVTLKDCQDELNKAEGDVAKAAAALI